MAISMKTTAAIALALTAVTLPAAVSAATTVATVTTGTAAPGGPQPGWLINGGTAFVPTAVNGAWVNGTNNSNPDGARWITPNQDGNISLPAGVMAYSTMFTLSNIVNVSTAGLSGSFWADNRVMSIILNGITIFTNGSSASQFAFGANGTLMNAGTGSFLAGNNNITFNVENYPGGVAGVDNDNPAGFRSVLAVTAAVPEPGAWLLMLMGFGFIGFQMRRRQNTQVRFQFA